MDLWFTNSIDDLLSVEEQLDSVAMSFFNTLGHTCTTTALFSDSDVMHFVYGTLAPKTVLSSADRNTLLQVQNFSLLFKMDGSVFDDSHCRDIFYFAVDLSVPVGLRSSIASEIQRVLSRIVKEASIILFRNEGAYMLSFTEQTAAGKERVVMSDWFYAGSHDDSYYEAFAAFNFSFSSSIDFYADFRHTAARQYYAYPYSHEFVRYEIVPSLIDDRDYMSGDDIAAMVSEILLEPIKEYGDDYVDDEYLIDCSSDELEDTDFDLLEYKLEQLGVFAEDFQEDTFDDENELSLQESPDRNLTFDSSSIPADIMRDPVKLLAWLEEDEKWKNGDSKSQSPKPGTIHADELLLEVLELEDLDYIDNRKKGGVFWIIGGLEISTYIQDLNQKLGYSFVFKAGGGRATTGEDAWWTK